MLRQLFADLSLLETTKMAEYLPVVIKKKCYKSRRDHTECSSKLLYRFTKETVDWLADNFLGPITETRGGALSNGDKMRVYLRYLADPGFQSGIGEDIGIHQATVSRTICELSEIISNRAADWINFPSSDEDFETAQVIWRRKYKFPFAVGAIDCTHFEIKKPCEKSDEYICRKRYHSLNVQATCDANEVFTSVDISWPGSVHDSRIFKNSKLYSAMKYCNNETVLLGDEGYGISPWLMTPFRNPASNTEQIYNNVLTTKDV